MTSHPLPYGRPDGIQDPVPAELRQAVAPYEGHVQPWVGATGVWLRIARTSMTPVGIPIRVIVDSRVVAAGLGDTFITLPPGEHQVAVAYQKPNGDDVAVKRISVRPGEVAEVHYSLPRWAYAGGSIGLTPQPHKGGAIWLVLLLPLALIVMLFGLVIALLFGLS